MNYEADISANADGPEMAAAGSTLGNEGEYVDAPKRRRTRLIIILALIGLVAAIVAWFVIAGNKEEVAEPEEQLPVVTVVAPGRTTVEGEIAATGTLAARRAMPVGVVGEGGRVVTVTVEAGSWVRQGQVLAVIDRSVQTQQAQSAAAQIQVARADAELAQANLERALKLVEKGFVSQADVDRLTATRDAANARVRVAQASLRELQARNARLNVTAPAAGLVLKEMLSQVKQLVPVRRLSSRLPKAARWKCWLASAKWNWAVYAQANLRLSRRLEQKNHSPAASGKSPR